jgi:hypothetical protein
VVEDWDGWVFCEEASHNDGFFENISELIEWWEDEADTDVPLPELAYCCKTIPFRQLYVSDLMDSYLSELPDGYADQIDGDKELQLALDRFCQINQALVSYEPDYKRVVRIVREPHEPPADS